MQFKHAMYVAMYIKFQEEITDYKQIKPSSIFASPICNHIRGTWK